MKRHESAPEPEILKRVTVRLLREAERLRFDALLEQKHYLCSALGCQRDRDDNYAPPSDSTFYRVLRKLDTQRFDRIVGDWLLVQEISVVVRLAVDGKALRGSTRTDGKPLQLLSAVTHRLRLTLAQVLIEDKSNEIPAYPRLMRDLPPVT